MELKTHNPEVKTHIINVACQLFSEKGFEGTSVREIANQSAVNIAMISYYFGGKEGLYFECISHFAHHKLNQLNQTLTSFSNTQDFKQRLQQLISNKMRSFAEDLQAHKIIMRELQTERDPEFHKKIMTQLVPVFDKIKDFFQMAIDQKIVHEHYNAEHLTLMLMGVLSHPCIAEKAMQTHLGYNMTDPINQERYIQQVCQLFFAGVIK